MSESEVYRPPRYYAIGYRWNTEAECDFIEACLAAYGPSKASRLLDIGCGAGRHTIELARRGYRVPGVDVSPEMVAFVPEESKKANLPVTASVDDLRCLSLRGTRSEERRVGKEGR